MFHQEVFLRLSIIKKHMALEAGIKVVKLNEEEFVINEVSPNIDKLNLMFEFEVNRSIKPDGEVTMFLTTKCHPHDSPEVIWFSLKILIVFMVTGLPNQTETGKITIKIPKLLMSNLVAVAFSTLRGMVFERLKSEGYNGVILPITNASEIADRLLGNQPGKLDPIVG